MRQEPNAKASRVQGNRERSIAALNATGFLLAGLYSMRTGGYSFTTTNERCGAAPLRQPDVCGAIARIREEGLHLHDTHHVCACKIHDKER